MSSEMNINSTNYESWFLDYYEGSLSAEQVAEMFLFLDQHPELQQEFESFELIKLDNIEEDIFENKQSLHKSEEITAANIHHWLLDQAEGQLNPGQLQQLQIFLAANPEYIREQELIAKTRLDAAEEVHPAKTFLYDFTTPDEQNIQHWLIAETEDALTLQQRVLLGNFLQANPQYQRDREIYRLTHLDKTNVDVYPNKENLKRGTEKRVIPLPQTPGEGVIPVTHHYKNILRIAAVLCLLIGAYFIFRISNGKSPQENIAGTEKQVTPGNSQTTPYIAEEQKKEPDNAAEKTTTAEQPSVEIQLPAEKTVAENPVRNRKQKNTPSDKLQPAIQQQSELQQEQLATISPLPMQPIRKLYVEEPLAFVERRYTPKATPGYNDPSIPPSLAAFIGPDEENSALTAGATSEETLIARSKPKRLTFGSKLLRFAAKSIGKISGEKIKVRTAFNPVTGKISAYEIETGKKVIQKQF
jgi:hypothetical protein